MKHNKFKEYVLDEVSVWDDNGNGQLMQPKCEYLNLCEAISICEETNSTLLKTCENIVNHFDGETDCTDLLDMIDKDIRKAINKAKGE